MPSIREHYRLQAERQEASAAKAVDGFEFRNLSSHAEGQQACDLWRCQKPGTWGWCFDIALTSRGIAVFGDIDAMVFKRGYGLGLLACPDLSYIASKLDDQCKEQDFDRVIFLDHCLVAVKARLIELDSDSNFNVDDMCGVPAVHAALQSVKLTRRVLLNTAHVTRFAELSELESFLNESLQVDENAAAAHEFFRANAAIVGADSWEHRVTQLSENLMVRLCALRIAARAILAQTQGEVDDDVETSDSDGSRGRLRAY